MTRLAPPRCSANIREPYLVTWRLRQGQDQRCTFTARFLVNDKPLCSRHAGELVLDLLTKQQPVTAEKIE